MNLEQGQSDYKRIMIVVGVLILLLIGIVFIRNRKPVSIGKKGPVIVEISVTPVPAIYELSASSGDIHIGSTFTVDVVFDSGGRSIDSSDVLLKFDPLYLSAESKIQPGQYFSSYPRTSVNNSAGTVQITAFTSQPGTIENNVKSFTIAFKAKKSGQAEIGFLFGKGSTNQTTLVEHKTSRNVLTDVKPLRITIKS